MRARSAYATTWPDEVCRWCWRHEWFVPRKVEDPQTWRAGGVIFASSTRHFALYARRTGRFHHGDSRPSETSGPESSRRFVEADERARGSTEHAANSKNGVTFEVFEYEHVHVGHEWNFSERAEVGKRPSLQGIQLDSVRRERNSPCFGVPGAE